MGAVASGAVEALAEGEGGVEDGAEALGEDEALVDADADGSGALAERSKTPRRSSASRRSEPQAPSKRGAPHASLTRTELHFKAGFSGGDLNPPAPSKQSFSCALARSSVRRARGMEYSYTMRLRFVAFLAAVLGSLIGCAPRVSSTATAVRACAGPTARTCEGRAIAEVMREGVAPEVRRQRLRRELSKLDESLPRAAFGPFFDSLVRASTTTVVVRLDGAPCAPCAGVAKTAPAGALSVMDGPPELVASSPEPWRLLAALARAAEIETLVIVDGPSAQLIFARDPLRPFMAGASPHVRVAVASLSRALALSQFVTQALEAAGRRDYPTTAERAEELRLMLATGDEDEATVRARDAVAALELAGVTLERPTAMTETEPARALPTWSPSSAYAALGLVRAHGREHPDLFARYRPLFERELEAARFAVLERRYSSAPPCVDSPPLPFDQPEDLIGLPLLAEALDPKAGPGRAPRPGKLALTDWLGRYEAALRLVEREHLGWHAHTPLLGERGGGAGFAVEGSDSWRRTTALADAHARALEHLSLRHPARFAPFSLGALALMPGVAADPALRRTIAESFAAALGRKLRAAPDTESLLTAILLAGVMAMNAPGYVQGAELSAVATTLDARLEGDLANARGWSAGMLHAGRALARLALGVPRPFEDLGPALDRALAGEDLRYPVFGDLTRVAVAYASLAASDKLDLTIANPRLYSTERSAARERLATTLRRLDPAGPSSPLDEDLLLSLTDYGDALLGVVVGSMREPQASTATCEGKPKSRSAPVRDALDRAQKKRRLLERVPAMRESGGSWSRRARLVALLLSDLHDLVEPPSKPDAPRFSLPTSDAERIVAEAFAGWLEGPAIEAGASLYKLARAVVSGSGVPSGAALLADGKRAVAALGRLFGDGKQTSLFRFVSEALDSPAVVADLTRDALTGRSSEVFVTLAARAYATGLVEQGDVLLLVASAISGAREGSAPESAIALAEKYDRTVALPLVARSATVQGGRDPARLERSYQRATRGVCRAPEASGIFDVERALGDFRRGDRRGAVQRLLALLDRNEAEGLVVPRQTFSYRETSGRVVFKLDLGSALAVDLLDSPGILNLGLGVEGNPTATAPRLSMSFDAGEAPPRDATALRVHAHTAALTSVLARLDGDHASAANVARRALASYVTGARLGDDVMVPSDPSAEAWPRDAGTVLALAAQQAVEAGEPFLAGSLLALLPRALGEKATDADVLRLTRHLPSTLDGVDELVPTLRRATQTMTTVAAPLACTEASGEAPKVERVSCEDYPLALALRIAGVSPKLPRLAAAKSPESPTCAAYRTLDAFLGSVHPGGYDPESFVRAVGSLRGVGRLGDAAAILGQHRLSTHCTPAIVDHARALGREASLGVYLRADVLSAAVVCGRDDAVAADLVLLDDLTSRHPVPLRSFEVLAAALEGARAGSPGALLAITSRTDFLARWRRVSPDLGALALLAKTAAERLAPERPSDDTTAASYALLCSSFPAAARTSLCNTVSLLRSGPTTAAATTAALDELVAATKAVLASQKPRGVGRPSP
ncbi:MAG: hypothetical protein FJ095_06340 [Deltaproteobacteria bacterium]|nr:hypothetical protein [Deltaproteobacteria bacterium]